MRIDVHVHIFSKNVRTDRAAHFPGEPAFRLLYDSPKSRIVGAAETIRMMDEEEINRAVVFGFPWKNGDVFRRENDYIAEAVARFPDRLTGFCCFDANRPDAGAETERCLNNGLKGVGELAFYENGIDESALAALAPIMEICLKNDAPVLIHANEPVGHIYPGKSPNTLKQIYDLAKAFPENRIILAHWGGGIFFFHLLKREAKTVLANVWYDTAASPFLYDHDIYAVAAGIVGPEKILLGTDFPLLRPSRYLKEITAAGVEPELFRKIEGSNAADLLGC